MSTPKLQRIDPLRESGPFGTGPFGTIPFGGSDAEPFELTTIQLGSSDLTTDLERQNGGVTHYRLGIPVASRTWFQGRTWTLNLTIAPQEYIEQLRQYWMDREFYLYPDKNDDSTFYKVMWTNDTFQPQRVGRPGYYSLTASFMEVPG